MKNSFYLVFFWGGGDKYRFVGLALVGRYRLTMIFWCRTTDIGGMHLTGTIPSQLGELTSLTELNLMFNELVRFIHIFLCNDLFCLWLDENEKKTD